MRVVRIVVRRLECIVAVAADGIEGAIGPAAFVCSLIIVIVKIRILSLSLHKSVCAEREV